jgi:hypothetical protein
MTVVKCPDSLLFNAMTQIEDMPISGCAHEFQVSLRTHSFIAKQQQRIEISLDNRICRQDGLQKPASIRLNTNGLALGSRISPCT